MLLKIAYFREAAQLCRGFEQRFCKAHIDIIVANYSLWGLLGPCN